MSVIRLLVCGGRHYADSGCVERVLDAVHRKHAIEVLIHGACPKDADGGSADMLADDWAKSCRVPVLACPVDHALDGPWPAAGPKRNQRMFDTHKPTHGVAFPGERGTKGMVRIMKEAGLPVWEIR